MNERIIEIDNLSIKFPIYGIRNLSLKTKLIDSVIGGDISNESKNFISVEALKNISFSLYSGDRLAILGHNGSGKSTLLKAVAGIYHPSSGSIKVNGSITSMLDITIGLNSDATGLENIMISGMLQGLTKKKINSITDEIVNFSGLNDYINLPLRTYSTGMSMRLAFSIASSVDADVVLIDEWLSVGDSEFSLKVKNPLKEMANKAKVVILATHDVDLSQEICNKFIFLEHGAVKN